MAVAISFPGWFEVLEGAGLPDRECRSHRVIIQWYLGYLKREGERATVETARGFLEGLLRERQPADWQVEQWRSGLNWFFREAPNRRRFPSRAGGEVAEEAKDLPVGGRDGDGRRRYAHTIREVQGAVPLDPWYEEMVRLMRVRHMAYRTEESYVGWVRRMERFLGAKEG